MLTPPECARVCVVLVRTRNPLNIGAAARAISNFGFSDLRVVAPYEAAFREARSAVGASSILAAAREFPSVADAVADCTLVAGATAARHRQLHHPLKILAEAALAIRKELASARRAKSARQSSSPPRRVAILFGSEKTGLSNEAFSHCHWLLRIPTADSNFSMNLGQAVAVCLYELIRGRDSIHSRSCSATRATSSIARAPSAELERLTSLLLDVSHASGYLPPETAPRNSAAPDSESMHAPAIAAEKFRRLVRRLNISPEDAQLWMGIFRQIAWKLRPAK